VRDLLLGWSDGSTVTAGIQQTISALVDSNTLVVGLGTGETTFAAPRIVLEAISKATGTISQSASSIPNGTFNPIELGEPLYFKVGTSDVVSGMTAGLAGHISQFISEDTSHGTLFRYADDYTSTTSAGFETFGQVHL
jgi:hypothetical protein